VIFEIQKSLFIKSFITQVSTRQKLKIKAFVVRAGGK